MLGCCFLEGYFVPFIGLEERSFQATYAPAILEASGRRCVYDLFSYAKIVCFKRLRDPSRLIAFKGPKLAILLDEFDPLLSSAFCQPLVYSCTRKDQKEEISPICLFPFWDNSPGFMVGNALGVLFDKEFVPFL